jgi:hypothetical protein
MEFWPAVCLILGVYSAFVFLFFRFMHMMHRKEVVMVQSIVKRF